MKKPGPDLKGSPDGVPDNDLDFTKKDPDVGDDDFQRWAQQKTKPENIKAPKDRAKYEAYLKKRGIKL
jgi:hypothetical protein